MSRGKDGNGGMALITRFHTETEGDAEDLSLTCEDIRHRNARYDGDFVGNGNNHCHFFNNIPNYDSNIPNDAFFLGESRMRSSNTVTSHQFPFGELSTTEMEETDSSEFQVIAQLELIL